MAAGTRGAAQRAPRPLGAGRGPHRDFLIGKIHVSFTPRIAHLLKQEIEQLLASAVNSLVGSPLPEAPAPAALTIERSRDPQHGDFATNAALRLAKAAGCYLGSRASEAIDL